MPGAPGDEEQNGKQGGAGKRGEPISHQAASSDGHECAKEKITSPPARIQENRNRMGIQKACSMSITQEKSAAPVPG